MNSKYEISIWSDVYDKDLGRFVERKEMVIGSNTMTSESRARNPKLINNIDGTNKFSFDLYYRYIDTRTGEEIENPYIPYLVNERKVKVFWKDEWYDLLVKQIKEDQVAHKFSYTCEDSYITELSRTGFELVFDTELENNIGTPRELIEQVIDGTDWRFDEDSEKIYQQTEEAVYEVTILSSFTAQKCPKGEDLIEAGKPALIYYSCAPDINNLKTHCSFYYAGENFKTDVNEMLAINGNCYEVDVTWSINDNEATAQVDGNNVFTIIFGDESLSRRFRAERFVDSQQMVYNDVLKRYVYVYKRKDDPETLMYGYQSTDYDNALVIVNLFTNASNFKNISGWSGSELYFKLSPGFDQHTDITAYTAKSYLRLVNKNDEKITNNGLYFNTGIQNNRAYISKGFTKGEKYIFRIRAIEEPKGRQNFEPSSGTYVQDPKAFTPILKKSVDEKPEGNDHFIIDYSDDRHPEFVNNWLEYPMICNKSSSYDDLLTAATSCGLFLQINTDQPTDQKTYWVEEIQFFKEAYGERVIESEDEDADEDTEPIKERTRINPNDVAVQSVANLVWKYFDSNQTGITEEEVVYTYTAPDPWDELEPVMNEYQRYGTIEEAQSNRFNILQSIAETFECWIRFRIEHDERGAIKYDKDGPCKYVAIRREAGQETGIGFIYGIDLKGITRTIKSDKIATKTIVQQNENEFGKNGFCTIARSEQNYPRDTFIYNFDYYIQHSLLDKDILYKDLYGVNGYYLELHDNNVDYMTNLEQLTQKKAELTRQDAMHTVYEQYIAASKEELASIEESIMKLAGVDTLDKAINYAKTHYNDTKLESLINDKAYVEDLIGNYTELRIEIEKSIRELNRFIKDTQKAQDEIIERLRNANKAFYQKYSRFIQEGTWQSEDYYNDDLYYLDAVQVAYTSSRPQISYEINVLRLSELEDYRSKVFHLGDISFVQDVKYFGYLDDGITPYKEKVVLTEITSCFDTPDKDVIKVQNYKTQFDDLFQRITAATQSLEFSEGKYAKAANIVQSDGTIKESVIQNTFTSNEALVYLNNQSVRMDIDGITVSDNEDASRLLKITSGGVFASSDGGNTWKNAVRGDGINTELLTAGRINTENIMVYNGSHPSFRWDPNGLNAYRFNQYGVDTSSFVRFDQYGVYGIEDGDEMFVPTDINDIVENANFGLVWGKFFMKNSNADQHYKRSIEISTDHDIVIQEQSLTPDDEGELPDPVVRVNIGRLGFDEEENTIYGMVVRDTKGGDVFRCDNEGSYLSGWVLDEGTLQSPKKEEEDHYLMLDAAGSIGAYGMPAHIYQENVFANLIGLNEVVEAYSYDAGENVTLQRGTQIQLFVSSIGSLTAEMTTHEDHEPNYPDAPEDLIPVAPSSIQFIIGEPSEEENKTNNYQIDNIVTNIVQTSYKRKSTTEKIGNTTWYHTTHIYTFRAEVNIETKAEDDTITTIRLFTIDSTASIGDKKNKYVPDADTAWYIDKDGQATFHNILADGGRIAGWWIDDTSIYQTYDGTKDRGEDDKNVRVSLNSSREFDYSIITDAINAAIATVGGLVLQNGLINGYDIKKVNTTATHANWFAQSHYHSLENVPISVTIDGTPHDGYITGGNTSGNPKGGPGG